MNTLQRRLNVTAMLSMALAVIMTLGSIVFVVTHPGPTPVGQALTDYCVNFGDNIRVTALSADGDGTWTFAHAAGNEDTLGRGIDLGWRGFPIEEVYPSDEAEEVRNLGLVANRTGLPVVFKGVVNDTMIETRIVPVIDGLTLFCSEVEG